MENQSLPGDGAAIRIVDPRRVRAASG
jgi:hypothetical protein